MRLKAILVTIVIAGCTRVGAASGSTDEPSGHEHRTVPQPHAHQAPQPRVHRADPHARPQTRILRGLASSAPLTSGRTFEEVGKRVLNRSPKTTTRMLSHAAYGPPYREIIRIAEWVTSSEGKRVNHEAAIALNQREAEVTRAFAQEFEDEVRFGRILEMIRDPAAVAGAWRAEREEPLISDRRIAEMRQNLEAELVFARNQRIAEIDPIGIFHESATRVIDPARSTYQPAYADLLMHDFRLVGTDFFLPRHFLKYVQVTHGSSKATLSVRSLRAVTAGLKAAGINQARARKFVDTVDGPLRAAGYLPRKPKHVAIGVLSTALRSGPFRERIFSRVLTRAEIERELDAILDEALADVHVSPHLREQLIDFERAEFFSFYLDCIPERTETLTANSLTHFHERVLANEASLLVQARDRDDAVQRNGTSQARAPDRAGEPSESQPGKKLGDREARICAYRAEHERSRLDALTAALQRPFSPTESQAPEQTSSPASVREEEHASGAAAAVDLERLIAERSVSIGAAAELLDLQSSLPEANRNALDAALRELLHPEKRRLQAQQHGSIAQLAGHDFRYLRINGDLPIRVYFGIGPEGPMIIAAQQKHNDAEQRQMIQRAQSRWKEYLKAL